MTSSRTFITLADRLSIPDTTKAILWDMDGVLIDSLGLDLIIVNEILQKYFGPGVTLSRECIRSIFAYAVPDFWKKVLEEVARQYGKNDALDHNDQILSDYDPIRQKYHFLLNEGVTDIISAARKRGLRQAVVSNTPLANLQQILKNAGFADEFELLVGNDLQDEGKQLRKKPAPDPYIFAAKSLGFKPDECVVIEDSLLGAEAGHAAGCFVIGVATGGATEDELRESGMTDAVYASFVDKNASSKNWDV